ncbi:beta-lactamase superfamily domain-containing protein [Apiosordaria backusii]|uniref:Beta-lactamase superfamily domain-containing protein n=1 Tax=Apiosordaria backusii TaxID=314023 RepID=A0AA40E114_9PEZI|nr:beta-lactamase superfamily domain-containing protein [Apiosordaria backusii]
MAPSVKLSTPLSLTHIGTATALIHLGDDTNPITLITDPFFSHTPFEFDFGILVLRASIEPALTLGDLPPIDAVLLSHEDHVDNLDEPGRRLLDGRIVLTTPDGAKNLAPRPGVKALQPWETTTVRLQGQTFEVTGTPCVHLPGGEVTGFILTNESFGTTDGKPNAIFFSGDTIYIPELAKMKEKYHISVALLNLGKATAPLPTGPLQITMDGAQAVQLFRELEADVLVPMHFESWEHFKEQREGLEQAFKKEGLEKEVLWLEPGKKTRVV